MKPLPKFEKTFTVEIEVWVMHRSETFVKHFTDSNTLDWKACVRHSNGVMEWHWFEKFEQAVEWCERFGRK